MKLKDLLYKVSIESVRGVTDVEAVKIEFDSRKITAGDVFVAIRGSIADGHDYIDVATANGAVAIV